MKKILYRGLAAIIVIAAAYYFWIEVYVSTPEEALAHSNIHYGEILHKAKVEEGVLIFYRDSADDRNVCVAYEEFGLTGWKHVIGRGAAVKDDNNALSYCWSVIKKNARKGGDPPFKLAILFGEIENPDISSINVKANLDTDKVKIKKPLIERQAQIINCPKARLWLVITDQDMSTAMKIYAYSVSGELLFTGNDWEAKPGSTPVVFNLR